MLNKHFFTHFLSPYDVSQSTLSVLLTLASGCPVFSPTITFREHLENVLSRIKLEES